MAEERDVQEMLKTIGVESMDELFSDIPEEVRLDGLDLPEGMSEMELKEMAKSVLSKNTTMDEMPTFLGAGIYRHYIPSAIKELLSRSELYTSYTPYQAEISQGMLQSIFEYQSLMVELTGMDVSNASLYDGSTALGEAALMAARITRKDTIIVPKAMLWEKRSVLENYAHGPGLKIKEVPYEPETGRMDLEALSSMIDDSTAALYFENPNLFGVLDERVDELKEIAGKALLIVGVNPISLGIIRPPGDYGADIVIGEAQGMGMAPNFGGPLLGIFTTRKKYLRQMPGRIIGMTKDSEGNRAFTMTMQTREQHIRRARATSNICSNEALCALASAMYLSMLGREGLRKLAKLNMHRAKGLAERISAIDGFELPFKAPFFNEFVVRYPTEFEKVHEALLNNGIHGGLSLKEHFPELGESALYTITETTPEWGVEKLIETLKGV